MGLSEDTTKRYEEDFLYPLVLSPREEWSSSSSFFSCARRSFISRSLYGKVSRLAYLSIYGQEA